MMDRFTKRILLAALLGILAVVVFMGATGDYIGADAPACWFYDDWGNCSGWCEPGNASCKWPDANFYLDLPGTAWGGDIDKNLNLTFGNPGDAGWAWGPFYCPAEGIVNISVKMKGDSAAGVAVGLFVNDSVPITSGGGMWYTNSIYFGSNGFPVSLCPYEGNFFALGIDVESFAPAYPHPNCAGGICDCTTGPGGCVFFYDTDGPYADVCVLSAENNQWLWDGAGPDGAWHTFAVSFNTATGETLCYFDSVYMGIIHADDMAGKNLYFQLYGIGLVGNIVYWDDFLLDGSSGGTQVSSIGKPLGPTNLLADGITNTCMYNATPNLSCTAWHTTSTVMVYQQIMVAVDSGFHYLAWDSGIMDILDIYSGQHSNVVYNGSSLIWNTRYYWKTRFIDCNGVVGDWSDIANFTYGAVNCGTFGNATPHGIFPPTNISMYGTDCDPDIFLRDAWRSGATAMGFTCPVIFEQLILGLAAIPIGIAVAFAVNFTMAGVLASVLWFGGLGTMHVYPWWIVLVVSLFLLSIWFTLRRTGA